MSRAKIYQKAMPILWWVHRWEHLRFITRELTSLFVAYTAAFFLLFIRAVLLGAEAYSAFLIKMQSPFLIAFNGFALLWLLYHSVTWFNLAPKAMVIKAGEYKVPDSLILLSNYAGWIVISGLIIWVILYF